MNLYYKLEQQDIAIFTKHLQRVSFRKGDCLIQKGSSGNGCYIIETGTVRIESSRKDPHAEHVVRYLQQGHTIGEFSLVDDIPRSADYYAHTDVSALWLPVPVFKQLQQTHPSIAIKLLRNLSGYLAHIIRSIPTEKAYVDSTTEYPPEIDDMVALSKAAQQEYESWPEERVDALLQDIADTITGNAEALAASSVAETGYGITEDKIKKIQFAAQHVFSSLNTRKASGIIHTDTVNRVIEIASPVGVILGLIPVTNPVSTFVFKTLISLKSRNSLILSSHRKAERVCSQTGDLIRECLVRHKAPPNLLQWIRERSSRYVTALFMKHKDVSLILATGGSGMVKTAYSSGKPAIGVSAGNAPVLICDDTDPDQAARLVIESKSFDNGIICGSENNLVVVAAIAERFTSALSSNGAAVLDANEAARLRDAIIDTEGDHLRADVVGKSAQRIAELANIRRDFKIKLLVMPLDIGQTADLFAHEKLMPVLSLFICADEAAAFVLCEKILNQGGKGHTAIIHTMKSETYKSFGISMPASRILVNCGGSFGCVGMGNGLSPSLTLGCGTLGGNSTTDNIGYRNLLNIKRLAY